MASLRAKWPGQNELLSWWIYHKLQESPMYDLDDPDKILEWLKEFRSYAMHDVHLLLYAKYQNFRIEYVNPHYMGYSGSQNGKQVTT